MLHWCDSTYFSLLKKLWHLILEMEKKHITFNFCLLVNMSTVIFVPRWFHEKFRDSSSFCDLVKYLLIRLDWWNRIWNKTTPIGYNKNSKKCFANSRGTISWRKMVFLFQFCMKKIVFSPSWSRIWNIIVRTLDSWQISLRQ